MKIPSVLRPAASRRAVLRSAAALAVAAVLHASAAAADIAVLIPGYLGDADTWREAGITSALVRAGWRDGGKLSGLVPGNVRVDRGRSDNVFYIADAPSEAPLLYQAELLKDALQRLRARGKDAPIILVGHSAGGVVARLFMVQYREPKVHALITIASPHLGTEAAELGLMTSLSPLGFLAPFVGAGTLNRSRGLYADLTPERPGDLLYWLNRQPHPDSIYISVVRKGKAFFGNLVVPSYSQDLNHVYALRGKAKTVVTTDGHGLERRDGPLLVKLLREVTK
jgi:triacylglycerol lipase